MNTSIFPMLGEQLRRLRTQRGMSQPALAARLGRDRARISELERDLLGGRWGRDRLTLFAEICDALNVAPVLVPKAQVSALRDQVDGKVRDIAFIMPVKSPFDELFIDLDDENGEVS